MIKIIQNKNLNLDSIEEIGPATKVNLTNAGVGSVKDLVVRGPYNISEITGLSIEKAVELCNKARIKLEELGALEKSFITATELYNKRQSIARISTGSRCLDELLGGGIETGSITEIYGEFGSGKTQICHTTAILVQQSKKDGGLEGKAIYVDTENTFRPERIVSISKARNIEYINSLENIIVAKVFNSSHQELVIQELGKIIENNNIKLVLLDSAISHFRAEFLGRGTLSERQQRLNKLMHMLIRIAEIYNIAIIITNQIQSTPDIVFGDPYRPTGGNVIAHASTYRVYLKKAGKNRIARIVDSPYHAEIEALFSLGEKGITDPI
ncbi:MAG: DNA repair and recombination protein RadA [Nitrososphaeraceae archaeon]|nr:DNA repair and recombination protein RadA [Nitrososphaeraceae archaeon]